MNRRRTISWLAACATLIALVALAVVCTTCGGGGGRKKLPITPPPIPPSTGTTEWVHTWGGSSGDIAHAVVVDAGGSVYIAGETSSFGVGDKDALLLKYSSDGTLLWQKTWGGNFCWTEADALAADDSGNVYVAGKTSCFGAGMNDVFLLKYSSSGSLLWQKTWGGVMHDDANSIAVDASGNVHVVGSTSSYGAGNNDAFHLKYSLSGDLLWQKTWGGSGNEYANAVAVDTSGDIYVAGWTNMFAGGQRDVLFLKYSPGGNLLWQRTWGGGNWDYAYDLATDGTGSIYVAGSTASFGASIYDAFLLKCSSTGSLTWQRMWGGDYYDWVNAIELDQAGDVYATGYSYRFGRGFGDIFLFKYSSGGQLLSQNQWIGSSSGCADALTVELNGKVYIAGGAYYPAGIWADVSMNTRFPYGLMSTAEGEESTPEGVETSPAGEETTPEGLTDTGGDDIDVLIMKYDPS